MSSAGTRAAPRNCSCRRAPGAWSWCARRARLIDAAALPALLTVRTRRGGERLRPRPGGPTRTLKNLLQTERISLIERETLPLLFAGDHLVAAADLWVDARLQGVAPDARRMRLIWHRPA